MKIHLLGLVAGFGGVVLLAVSLLWPAPSPQEYWTDKDEAELSKKYERVHGLGHRVFAHGGNKKDRLEYEDALKDYGRERERYDEAVSRSTRTPRILRWLGILIGLAGFGLWIWKRPRDSDGFMPI